MKLFFKHIILCTFLCTSYSALAQSNFFLKNNVSKKINFDLIGNLIVLPVEINGVPLSFVLDSGVSKPILFNLTDRDSLNLRHKETFFLHGLGGDGKIEALRSKHNRFKFGEAVNWNQDLFVVFDESIDFTSRLGVIIHGIVGYDIFKNFVVEINYSSKFIRLHNPNSFKPKSKKWSTIPIEIHRNKAYLDAEVDLNNQKKNVKLLIDTGSSDALWLFKDENDNIVPNENKVFYDYLGKGLSGSVYGMRSKVSGFNLGGYELKEVNVAFPDASSIDTSKLYKERNGSIGGELLKRFNMFVDYSQKKIHLKKNSLFKKPFTYNNSGIVLEHHGSAFVKERIKNPYAKDSYGNLNRSDGGVNIELSFNYRLVLKPVYKIVEIRESSNAYKAGLRKEDILININGTKAFEKELSEINKILHGNTGKKIKMLIERNGISLTFKFKLDSVFNKNEPSNEGSK